MRIRFTLLAGLCLATAHASLFAADRPRLEFTRMIAHWDAYGDPEYLPFVSEAQPEIAQFGFYGAHFWSLVHTPHGKGYPAHFPVQGIDEGRAWFRNMNDELQQRNVKVVGHMNVKFLVGDPESPEGPRGFFHFYKNLWDEKVLGPKPVADPLDLLEKDKSGKPIGASTYSIGQMKEYWACLNNPNWRKVLKAWTKHGIDQGVDGFMINYFYRHDCHCPHCVAGFKAHMKERFKPDELKDQFGIADLAAHDFPEIVSWHDPKESTTLRREMLRWSQTANKQAFDEVFVEYGKSLKPDLIVGQWNHLGNFSQINGDERCLLPGKIWGNDEDYLWYSTGGAAYYTDLAEGFLGEGTLQARYIRGAFDDKPFTLGKYEGTRIRVAIAELAANGGAPMGFYTRFKDPAARKEIVRYYQFLKRYDEIYRANRPHAEALLVYPRSSVHKGNVATVEAFRQAGQELLNAHVLFDVIPANLVKKKEEEADKRYATVFRVDETDANATPDDIRRASDVRSRIPKDTISRFDAPTTVRVSANIPAAGNEIDYHFVNYNREEPAQKHSAGSGIADEKPIAVEGIKADVVLPKGFTPKSVEFLTPEADGAASVKFDRTEERLKFDVPKFLVYGVVRVRGE